MSHGLSEATVERIQEVLAGHTGVKKAVLYGSRAKGNHRPGSDIDLALCGDGLGHGELTRIADELDDLMLPYRIDVSVLENLTLPELLEQIRRVGIVLYDRDCGPTDGRPKTRPELSDQPPVK